MTLPGRLLRWVLLASTVACLASAQAATPGVKTPPEVAKAQAHEVWRKSLKVTHLPKKGCFTATYPKAEWHEVACKTGPLRPYLPRAKATDPELVGIFIDYSAKAASGRISSAEGGFAAMTGVTSESAYEGKKLVGPNTFSLQINSNTWNNGALCQQAPDKKFRDGCQTWQQFVFSNAGQLFMQYWLISYGPKCPAGWKNTPQRPDDCYVNGPNQSAPPPITNINQLADLSMIAVAQSGGFDTLILTEGDNAWSFSNDDAFADLAQNWSIAEFNVFGDGNGDTAVFNPGARITVKTGIEDADGSQKAPLCDQVSFTGESNNLTLSGNPALPALPQPHIEFAETNPPGPKANCNPGAGKDDSDAVYRWYLPGVSDHFYTENPTGELAPNDGYNYEGTPFRMFSKGDKGTTAFYRWFCSGDGHHFYTADPTGELAPSIGCTPEGTLGYIASTQLAGTEALYRWYNASTSDHFYTTDTNSAVTLAAGYTYEKIAGYVRPFGEAVKSTGKEAAGAAATAAPAQSAPPAGSPSIPAAGASTPTLIGSKPNDSGGFACTYQTDGATFVRNTKKAACPKTATAPTAKATTTAPAATVSSPTATQAQTASAANGSEATLVKSAQIDGKLECTYRRGSTTFTRHTAKAECPRTVQ